MQVECVEIPEFVKIFTKLLLHVGAAVKKTDNKLMKRSIVSMKPYLTLALFAGSLQWVAAADVTGKVSLKGTPKSEVAIDMGPQCGKFSKPATTRHYVVGKDGGLANVFVYIKDAKSTPVTGEGPTLDQVGCMYIPYVFGVGVNQEYKVKNSDPEMHNVHPTPKMPGNKEYNIAQMQGAAMIKKSFSSPEVAVRFKCDVHPWMFAYVGVFDHPYFAVTDADGNFKISGLPDGDYTLVAYHLKSHGANDGVVEKISVKGSAKKDIAITLP